MLEKWQAEFKRYKSLYFIYLIFFLLCLGSMAFFVYKDNQAASQKLTMEVVNMRQGPGVTYDIDRQLTKDTSYQIMREENDWYYVKLNDNSTGWLPKWLVNPQAFAETSSFIATVLADTAPIYEDNTVDSKQIAEAQKHQKFQILHQIDGWVQIQTDQGTAWISQDTIEITPGTMSEGAVITSRMQDLQDDLLADGQYSVVPTVEGVNIRQAPEPGAEIIGKTAEEDVLTYLGQEDAYYRVQLADGQEGYIANWLADSNATAMADLADQMEETSTLSDQVIVLDPGHGGDDPGAMNDTINEKSVTLKTVQAVKDKLEAAGATVYLTREDDSTVELGERVEISKRAGADAFISLHYDAYDSISASGTSTYYYDDGSIPLAQAVQAQLLEQLPLSSNGIRFGDFQVTRENPAPSLLLELGYMSNPSDVKTFTQDDYYQDVAEAVYDGLVVYFQK